MNPFYVELPQVNSENPDLNSTDQDQLAEALLLCDFLIGTIMLVARDLMERGEAGIAFDLVTSSASAYCDTSLIKSRSGDDREAMKLGLTHDEFAQFKKAMKAQEN